MLTHSSAPSSCSGSSLRQAFTFLSFCCWLVFSNATSAQQPPCFQPPDPQPESTTLFVQADHQKWIKNVFYGRGHVLITYKEIRMTSDQASYSRSTGDLDARGRVVFDDSHGHLEAARAHYNVYSDRGWFSKVHGYVRFSTPAKQAIGPPEAATPLFIRAEKIERLSQDTYTIEGLHASSCEKASEGVAFGMRSAKLQVGESLTGRGAVFQFLSLPMFYLPYVWVSASRTPRQTGFLLPQISQNSQKGFEIGDGFFWAMNPSADLMLGAEDYSLRGLGISGRFRARPSGTSTITANFFAIDDHESNPALRAPGGSFQITGESDDLDDGFRGVVNADYVNSLAFRETWSETFNSAVYSEAQQTGFATKNFDAYSLNFYASRYQDFLSLYSSTSQGPSSVNEPSVIIRHAPSVSFSGVENQIGDSPFYFSFDTSADGVGRSAPNFSNPTLSERIDLFPRITLRLHPLWNFRITPEFAVRETYYGTSLEPDHAPVNRLLGEISLDIRPPSVERVFAHPIWGHRFKHVIEPDIKYHWVKAADPHSIFEVVPFDPSDLLTEDNELDYSLTNALLERKAGQKSKQARDLISWTISQKYFFDPTFGGAIGPGSQVPIEPALSLTGFSFPEGRWFSPLDSDLRVSPSPNFDTEFQTDVEPQGGALSSIPRDHCPLAAACTPDEVTALRTYLLDAGVTSRVHSHSLDLALTDFFVNRTEIVPAPIAPSVPLMLVPTFNLLDVTAVYNNLLHKRLSTGLRVDYNLSQGVAEDVVSQVSYNFGCFGLNLQYQRFNLGAIRNENTFGFSITLGRIGTFGSLKPGEFLQRQLQQIP